MPSKGMVSLVTAATLAVGGLTAAQALATPTAATAPTISGTPAYGAKLTCNNGTWSAGAGSFTYAWELADGGSIVSTSQTVTVQAGWVGFGIQCAVTAKDATGSTTAASGALTIKPATATLTNTEARQTAAGTVTIRGKISPIASLNGGNGSLILYRRTKAGPQQLSFNGRQTRPNRTTGSFTLVAASEPTGRHTYVVQYVPSSTGFAQTLVTRSVNVSAR